MDDNQHYIKNLKVREELQSDILREKNQILYLINLHASKLASKLYKDSETNDDGSVTVSKELFQEIYQGINAMSDEKYYDGIESYITNSYLEPMKLKNDILNKLK